MPNPTIPSSDGIFRSKGFYIYWLKLKGKCSKGKCPKGKSPKGKCPNGNFCYWMPKLILYSLFDRKICYYVCLSFSGIETG